MGEKRVMHFRLTSEQKRLLIHVAAEEFVKNPGLGTRDAIEKGIRALPEEKRPKTYGEAKAKWATWLMPAFEHEVELIKGRPINEVTTAPQLGPEDFSTEKLLSVVIGRALGSIVPALQTLIQETVAEALKSKVLLDISAAGEQAQMVDLPPEPKVRKPKVTIVGLLPRQQQAIRREFGDELELRFIGNDVANVNKYTAQCDNLIGVTEYMSHKAEYSAKKNPNYTRAADLGELKDKLVELYVKATEGSAQAS